MNPLLIKLVVISLCAVCKLIGELWWHNAQRFIMPIILMAGIDLVLHSWWLGALCLPMIGALCLGYKTFGPSDGFNRAVWLLLICVTAGLGLTLDHHIAWYLYAPYCIIGAVWGGITRLWWNVIIAPISGAIIGSIIFLVR